MRFLSLDQPALQLLHSGTGSDFMRSLAMEIERSGSQPSLVQTWGGPTRVIRPGDVVWRPPVRNIGTARCLTPP
jgi:hypothetical protein